VISVTRLNGTEVVVNADLIETVESDDADTVVTLVDGKRYVVRETTQQVVDRIRHFRADIIRRVDDPVITTTAQLRVLRRTSDD
jgi:flagellar protein FlbD